MCGQRARSTNWPPQNFCAACKALKLPDDQADVLFRVALTTFPLTADSAVMLEDGRDVVAALYEDAFARESGW